MARTLTIMLLGLTLLLLGCGGTAVDSPASETRAANGDGEQHFFSVVYPIEDLLVPDPNNIGPGSSVTPPPERFASATRKELIADIACLVATHVAPASWESPYIGIRSYRGVLIITQTAENHASVLEFINILRDYHLDGQWLAREEGDCGHAHFADHRVAQREAHRKTFARR